MHDIVEIITDRVIIIMYISSPPDFEPRIIGHLIRRGRPMFMRPEYGCTVIVSILLILCGIWCVYLRAPSRKLGCASIFSYNLQGWSTMRLLGARIVYENRTFFRSVPGKKKNVYIPREKWRQL